MLLSVSIDYWLAEHRPTTARSYRHCITDMAAYIGPARPLDTITAEHILDYVHQVRSRDYAPATVHKYIKTLKTYWNWCVRAGLLASSPASGIRQSDLPKFVSRAKAMTDAELAAILAATEFKPRDHALIRFLADTGCRAGGVAGLTFENLDLRSRLAYVTEKGDKTRPVFFGDGTAQALRVWIRRHPRRGRYVFSRTAGPMSAYTVSQVIRRACKEAGIRTLSAHSLRHRKGHQFADHRIAPTIAAQALGHANPSITLAHYYPRDWERVRGAMTELSLDHVQYEDEKIIRLDEADFRRGG
jgi:integrase